MPSEKLKQILRAETDLSDEQIEDMSDREGWSYLYKIRPNKNRRIFKAQICFTGFSPTKRSALENSAKKSNYEIVKSVTKNLRYLCIGPNAGSSKLSKASKQNVSIITPEHFETMIKNEEVKFKNEIKGKIFVFDGSLLNYTRLQIKEKIQLAGGLISGSVSLNTDYLVIGDLTGSKCERAKALNVKILNEKELEKLLQNC